MTNRKIIVPPIKIQGIKTKLVPLILENVNISEKSRWVEPFLGSGVVAFNANPKSALLCDINPHIINFYHSIKERKIDHGSVYLHLLKEGKKLSEKGDEHYYHIRERFNNERNPLDFLFLNRSCFNGMIRFNKKLFFNVPYGHKPNRFSKSYITKIVNQVKNVQLLIYANNWQFKCQDFRKTLEETGKSDFIYCDPPYIGRHVDYYDSWDEKEERELFSLLQKSGADYMLSTWDHNKYRGNEYINKIWKNNYKINTEHFYHIGAKESNRNSMTEALITNYEMANKEKIIEKVEPYNQENLFESQFSKIGI